MKTTSMFGHDLPVHLWYTHGETRSREVASFVDDRYYSRGTVDETMTAIWFQEGFASFDRDTVQLVIDQPPGDPSEAIDRLDLTWTGPKLTVDQFLAWRASSDVCFNEADKALEWKDYAGACRELEQCNEITSQRSRSAMLRALRNLADDVYYEKATHEDFADRYSILKASIYG